MDPRRGRMVIDPIVRQVGFVTPGSEAQRAASEAVAPPVSIAAANSPSPVMIGPPQSKAIPMAVPSPKRMPGEPGEPWGPRTGSYNPSESLLASSPSPSSNGVSLGLSRAESLQLEGAGEMSPVSAGKEKGKGLLEGFSERLSIRAGDGADGYTEKALLRVAEAVGASAPVGPGPGPGPGPAAGAKAGREGVPPAGNSAKTLKERTSKAERRALQNAQRAVKASRSDVGGGKGSGGGQDNASTSAGPSQKEPKEPKVGKLVAAPKKDGGDKKVADKKLPSRMQFDDPQRVAKARKRAFTEQTEAKNRVELFRHLPQFVHGDRLALIEAKYFHEDVMHPHPAVYKIGLQYLTGDLVGGNARCVALLSAFREMIQDYSTPPEKVWVRDLAARINSQVSFLIECRPLSIGMGNVIKSLKTRIAQLSNREEAEAKATLIADIDRFLQEKVVFADTEIVRHAVTKIRDGDVLLTHGFSCVVEMILLRAHEIGRKFRVVVVDSRPKLEGRNLICRLLEKGLQCTYCQINSVSYIMQEVTRVFLGAASVLANGTVYSRVGTACVAMVAHSFHIPVMICCETYKFHERVQLDSICANELGDPDVLVKVAGRQDLTPLEGWEDLEHLQLLNLTYDATPSDYVAMIITELGMVPPTSVPVILREHRRESLLI